MAIQFSNACNFLQSIGLKMITPPEEFKKTKYVTFTCVNKHITGFTIDSFNNKRRRCNNDPKYMCTECSKMEEVEKNFQQTKKRVLETSGHTLLTLKNRKVTYKCKYCNNIGKTSLGSLINNKGHCPKCQNEPFKNDIKKVEKIVESYGYFLINYKNYHQVLLMCPKNHIYINSLFSLKRGRRCPYCAPTRRKKN
jgi:hypothetical protein